MEIIRDPYTLQKLLYTEKISGKRIGFVPTMGALHEGHIQLVKKCCNENDLSIVSIFVNPTQFNQNQDFERYPKQLDEDLQILKQQSVDFIFYPATESLYPDNYNYSVNEKELSKDLCGKNRPGHFQGVLTVVLKLLNIVQPDKAYFGEKDYQQLNLIQKMVDAFFIQTKIVPVPVVRSNDGLALSSRNKRLSEDGIKKAKTFAHILKNALSTQHALSDLKENKIKTDYIEEHESRRFGAVVIDDVRLIDNVQI